MKNISSIAPTSIIVIAVSPLQSALRDILTLISALVLIGFGHFIHTPAMTWVGALIFLTGLFSVSYYRDKKLTPQQAADMLRRKYNVTSK